MPSQRCGKVRRMLKDGQAIVVNRCPFTIRLTYETTNYRQPITLGVDTGTVHVALSATTKTTEVCNIEATLRKDIVELLSTRRESRRTRRNRLRYRKPRFNNRIKTKKDGWIAPSIRHRIDSHKKLIKKVTDMLPITVLKVEIGNFDAQVINNPEIEGVEYQNGVQKGFWNVREYVLYRDKHICQCCKGKSKDPVLNVHHIESRKTGGNAPNNLITLCETCHNKLHKGELTNFKPKRSKSLRDAAVMNIIKKRLYDELVEMFPEITVRYTFGYITKHTRISNNIMEKSHRIDARCITGNPNVQLSDNVYSTKQVRTRNRHIEKDNILKGGKKKKNQCSYKIKGFRNFDKVKYDGKTCFITGKRTSGFFCLRDIDYKLIDGSVSYKKLKFVDERKSFLFDLVKN